MKLALPPKPYTDDILRRVFHSPAGGGLHVCDIKSAAGELGGLRASGAEEYFGLIYIGDTAEFKKLVEADGAGITLEEDAIASSLFTDINHPPTRRLIFLLVPRNSWKAGIPGASPTWDFSTLDDGKVHKSSNSSGAVYACAGKPFSKA